VLDIKRYKKELADLCDNNLAVNKLFFFGSVLTPKFNEHTSDIDVFIETANLPPEECGVYLIDLWDNLELLFNRKIDLLTENSLRNPILKKEVEQTKKIIYDRQSHKIFI